MVVGHEVQKPLGGLIPKLLGAFHAAVDPLDGRFHMAAGDRQSLLSILRIVHARILVAQITQRVGDTLSGR